MSRPSSFAGPRAIACLGLLALLAACSGGGSRTSSSVEAARYAAQARGNYAPPGPPGDPWGPYITEASNRFDVPDTWIRAVMHVESGGHEYLNGQLITSGAGAMGLMQVMPETYDELRQQYSLSDDPYDPHNNILAGTAYIREMYDIYGAPGFLAAYNAGPARLDDYLSNNRPLPDETRRYVAMIGPAIEGTSPRSRSPAEQYAMNTLPINLPPGPRYGRGTQYRANRNSGGGAPVRPVQVAQLPEPPPSRPSSSGGRWRWPHRRRRSHVVASAWCQSPTLRRCRNALAGRARVVGRFRSVRSARKRRRIAQLEPPRSTRMRC